MYLTEALKDEMRKAPLGEFCPDYFRAKGYRSGSAATPAGTFFSGGEGRFTVPLQHVAFSKKIHTAAVAVPNTALRQIVADLVFLGVLFLLHSGVFFLFRRLLTLDLGRNGGSLLLFFGRQFHHQLRRGKRMLFLCLWGIFLA